MKRCSTARLAAAVPLLLLSAACTDRTLTLPDAPTPPTEKMAQLECVVDVGAGRMRCGPLASTSSSNASVRTEKLLGGQEVYVTLASYGTTYDTASAIL